MAEEILALKLPDQNEPFCPLCLHPFVLDSKSDQRPTAEHTVQESLGGALEFPTLTCANCNNGDGRRPQGYLKKAMRVLDFMDGKGTMPTVIHNDAGHFVANVDWRRSADIATAGSITTGAE